MSIHSAPCFAFTKYGKIYISGHPNIDDFLFDNWNIANSYDITMQFYNSDPGVICLDCKNTNEIYTLKEIKPFCVHITSVAKFDIPLYS